VTPACPRAREPMWPFDTKGLFAWRNLNGLEKCWRNLWEKNTVSNKKNKQIKSGLRTRERGQKVRHERKTSEIGRKLIATVRRYVHQPFVIQATLFITPTAHSYEDYYGQRIMHVPKSATDSTAGQNYSACSGQGAHNARGDLTLEIDRNVTIHQGRICTIHQGRIWGLGVRKISRNFKETSNTTFWLLVWLWKKYSRVFKSL